MRLSSVIQAVDAHACGEHGRVITGGVLDVPGHTMFEKMCHLRDHADGLHADAARDLREVRNVVPVEAHGGLHRTDSPNHVTAA